MADTRPDRDADSGARLAAAARRRAIAAAADLALPEASRLGEMQRRWVAALLARLVRSVEDDLRSALAASFAANDGLHAALSSAHVEIALPSLGAGAWEPALITILLRRADEHRLRRAASDTGLLTELAGSPDEAVAAAAMAVLIGESRRRDSSGEPLLPVDELSAERAHHLVWTIAASLRLYIVREHRVEAALADAALAAAAERLLAAHDEGETFDAQALRLVRALDAAGRLDDSLVARLLAEGHLPLFLAALDLAAGLSAGACWDLLSDPAGEGAMLLLRAAGVGREAAGAILLRLHGESEAVLAAFERFEALERSEAADLLALWRADPAYRHAVARLAS
jgi:hypothetical protein